MHDVIDFRSDTVTRPTPAMRQAMADAPVGDDVYEDDPSINLLQERAAALMGKEAGLFVPSGTMSNAIAIKVHTRPGDEILLDGEAHSMLYEVGLPATIAHVLTRQFHSVRGVPDVEEIARSLHYESLHGSATSLLVLENTHNRAGGYIVPVDVHRQLFAWAQEHDVKLHLDGARLFNAVVASGVSAQELRGLHRLADVLPVERIGMPGRVGFVRDAGVRREGEARAQDAGRGHAAGRHSGGSGPVCAGQ